jgi:hypothetical protein
MASHAFMRAPIQLPTDKVDCGNRSNSMGGQVNDLQGLLHRVALVGEESGDTVLDDPNTEEAKNAEASGYALICGKDVGNLNLVEHNGKTVLVGTAHGFYEDNGESSCDEDFGEFFPDDHYDSNGQIDHRRGYRFKLPPLNASTLLRTKATILSDQKLNDLIILEIEDKSVLERQLGGARRTVQMSSSTRNATLDLSRKRNISIIGGRGNYLNYTKVSRESGCLVQPSPTNLPVLRHTCDTGPGSSGSSLNYTDDNQIYSIGIHYGAITGTNGKVNENASIDSEQGNYFIPAESVIEVLDSVIPSQKQIVGNETVSL